MTSKSAPDLRSASTAIDLARDAPTLRRPVVSDQVWENVAFLHWAVEASSVQAYLPPGTEPDVWTNGQTYLGLVPLRIRAAGPGQGVPVPYFGTFLETNIRLYSLDANGRHGVVFLSLDAARLTVVLLARWGIRIPYQWAHLRAISLGPVHHYQMRRRWPRPRAVSELLLQVGAEVQATPLEEFLTLRWGMHSRFGTRALWTPNTHERWPLHSADIIKLDDGLRAAAGFELADAPDLRPLWSPGVHTRFGSPSLI